MRDSDTEISGIQALSGNRLRTPSFRNGRGLVETGPLGGGISTRYMFMTLVDM